MIVFKNTEAMQAGISIRELRRINNRSLSEFADNINVSADYLTLLEEGHEDKVIEEIIEKILITGRVCKRGARYKREELKKTLLSIKPPTPPEEQLF